MFAGGRRRSSNVRAMQLFHELKQQFPTVPDHIVSACIANSNHPSQDIREVLEAAAAQNSPTQEPMGRTPPAEAALALEVPSERSPSSSEHPPCEQPRNEMNESDSDVNQNVIKPSAFYSKKSESVSVNASDESLAEQSVGKSSFYVKRPDHLDIKSDGVAGPRRKDAFQFNKDASEKKRNIRLSERCKDVHKLLNADNVNEKPPRSPLSARRFSGAKNSPVRGDNSVRSPLASPEASKRFQGRSDLPETAPKTQSPTDDRVVDKQSDSPTKPETVETPTQTTNTLLGGNSVNLSLNVNCSMDVVQSPSGRRSSVLQLTPQQPWIQEPVSPRSYTSVNLTLRPPTSEPQAPIDITSQNSSLTYSTSTFDSQKGLQSRLQITVGPGGGSVSSVRTRPRSSYLPENTSQDVVPVRTGSLPDLAASNEPPVVIKQQARIERLRIELNTEKAKLIVMKQEVSELESNQNVAIVRRTDEELEKQLEREILHLRCQCEQLTRECDKLPDNEGGQNDLNDEFYRNIYTGQRCPFALDIPNMGGQDRGCLQNRGPVSIPQQEMEGPKWNCHMCTFQNHPLLNKCEQCEMPRILHGTQPEAPDPNVAFSMIRPLGQNGPYVPNAAFNTNSAGINSNRPANLNVMRRTYANDSFRVRGLAPQVGSPAVFNNYNGMVRPSNPFPFTLPSATPGRVFSRNERNSPNRPERNRTNRPIPHI